jgi:hypothetical protein
LPGAQWQELQQAFPSGACDYSKPGVGQGPTATWMTYQDANGNVIYGGRPLGRPPVSVPFGPSSGGPLATGRLGVSSLGPVQLGMTRAAIRRALAHSSTRGKRYMEFFCLSPIGIPVGYASPMLLRGLSPGARRAVQGRVVLALTANRRYPLRGMRPGMRLAAVARRLHVARPFHIGLNYWYLAPNGSTTGVLKVRHGTIDEIGVAVKALTRTRLAAARFLRSFT